VHANIESAALSRDGKLMAFLRLDPASRAISVWLSSPPGSEPRPYSEAPFTQRYFDTGVLRFSPQGDRLVALIYTAGEPTEFWVLPLPSGRAYQVLRSSTADCVGFFPFSVLPDGRHILLEMAPRPDWTRHLFVADLERDVARPLTQTTRAELQPAVSPDGKRIAFTAQDKGSEMVRVPLDGSLMQTLRASAWYEASPSWSRRSGEIAYVCDRRGAPEIWMYDPRSGWQRPAVKREDFGNTDTFGLFDPVVSPDGQRIAYSRLGRTIGIWISPVAGGAPVALTPGTQERMHYSPAWSPDGKWIAYNSFVGGKNVLRKAEVGSRSPPVALPPFSYGATAQTAWSPRGDWIACRTPNGLTLVKADGGGSRVLATKVPLVFGWSDDGTLIYGLRVNTGRLVLVSINVETGREKRIADTGPAPRPPGPYSDAPLSGFSLSPDGKSFVTSISRSDSDIWILENFQMPAKSLWKFR
jgi:Tol biopolymer transport system component